MCSYKKIKKVYLYESRICKQDFTTAQMTHFPDLPNNISLYIMHLFLEAKFIFAQAHLPDPSVTTKSISWTASLCDLVQCWQRQDSEE